MSSSSSKPKNLRCALNLRSVPEICQGINFTLEQKYSYMVCPLIHPRFKRDHLDKTLKHQSLPLTRSDLLLTADCWQSYVVGSISKFYNCDSNNALVRKNAAEVRISKSKIASFIVHWKFALFFKGTNWRTQIHIPPDTDSFYHSTPIQQDRKLLQNSEQFSNQQTDHVQCKIKLRICL